MGSTESDIKQGFNALGGAVRIAGEKREKEQIAKNGYVGFKNPNAIAMFRSQNQGKYREEVVNGETRFSPITSTSQTAPKQSEKRSSQKTSKNSEVFYEYVKHLIQKGCNAATITGLLNAIKGKAKKGERFNNPILDGVVELFAEGKIDLNYDKFVSMCFEGSTKKEDGSVRLDDNANKTLATAFVQDTAKRGEIANRKKINKQTEME